ncbi:hypothetical protein D2Q93_13835 [Alicyclobacillaceae bacterium I2511]|nr:hypothetical protein D2Q93_13835 [Alicyclobacillaceae bacterium I2511]
MQIRSLRRYAAQQVEQVMGPIPKQREPRRWALPLVIILGLLPIVLPGLPVSWPVLTFHPSQLQELMNWMEWLWGGTATLFTLPVAVTALITGLGVPGTNRVGLFRYFRQHGFDGVVVLGLVLLASSALAISRALLLNQDVNPVYVGRILAGIIGGLSGLLVALGFLVWQTIVMLSSARDAHAQHQRLIRHLDATVHDIAIHLFAEKTLGKWAEAHKVLRLHLPLDSFDGSIIRAHREAVIRDIRLGLLTHWAVSLRQPVNDKISALAVTNFTLGKPVIAQERLAVVAPAFSSSERAFLRSFRWGRVRSHELTQELMDELVDLAANAVSDCAADRRSSFRVILKVYEDFYAEMLRLTSLLQSKSQLDISSDLVFATTWDHQLQEVGKAVVANGSDSLVSMWLFSMRRLLQIALRYGTKEVQIRSFFQLLADYALIIQTPPAFFWQYLDEYQIILGNELEHGKSPDRQKNALTQMRIQLTDLAPALLSGLPPSQFNAVTDWVRRVGAGLNMAEVSDQAMAGWRTQLEEAKSVLWLKYGNGLILQWQQGAVLTNLVQQQFRYLREQFESLTGLWATAKHLCGVGQRPMSRIFNLLDPGVAETRSPVGFGWGFLLISISLLATHPGDELPPDPEAMTWFQDYLQKSWEVMQQNPEKWSLLTPVPASYLPVTLKRVQGKFISSQHRGRMQQYQRIVATPLDDLRVQHFMEEVVHSAQAGGLQIVERFAQSGQLHLQSPPPVGPCFIPFLQEKVLSKRSFIQSGDRQELPTFYPPLWIYEEAAILDVAPTNTPISVLNRANAAVALKAAIHSLHSQGFHVDFLVLPTDERLIHVLHHDPTFLPTLGVGGRSIGKLAGVPLYQTTHWQDTILVADLTRWLRLTFCPDLATSGRYRVELRSPTPEELEHWLTQSTKVEFPVDCAEDEYLKRTFLQTKMVFTLREAILVEQANPEACRVYHYVDE